MDLNSTVNKRNMILADIGLLSVALFWGGGFVAGKFALTAMTPMNIMAYRYMGAALVIFCLSISHMKHLKDKKLLTYGALCGLLMFFGNSVQTIGLQYTTAGKQSFIISMYIVIVPMMNWLVYKIRPARSILTAAVIGLIGIALITLTDQLTVGLGDFLTFLFAITFSIQMIVTAKVIKGLDAMTFTFAQMLVVGILSAVSALITETPVSPAEMLCQPLPAIAGLLYLIFFNSAFAFMLQNICLRYAPANHSAIILSLETVFGTIAAITVAGEIFSPRMIAGCCLMFIAIGIVEFASYKKPADIATEPDS